MGRISSIARPAMLLLLFGSALLWSACGGPSVESTSIDGRVRQINNWAIEWAGDAEPTEDPGGTKQIRVGQFSKFVNPAECKKYTLEVKQCLISNRGFSFYDNMPPGGYLYVRPVGVVRTSHSPRNMGGHWRDDIGGASTEFVPEDPYDPNRQNNPLHRDAVRFVEVLIYDRDARFLGSIGIGDGGKDKVKPKHVAKAIANAITQGRAKSSKSDQ